MTTVTVQRTVQASPERLWSVATDIDRWAETMSGIDAVEVIDKPEFGVGTRWRETRTLMRRQATEEMWVTAVDEGRSYTVESESRGARYVSVLTLRPTGTGTEVEMSFTGEPGNRLAKMLATLAAPLARGAVVKALQQDLDDLATAAERAT